VSNLLHMFDTPSIILGPISFTQPVYDQITFEVFDAVEYDFPIPDSMAELITLQSSEIESNSIPSSVVPDDTQAMVTHLKSEELQDQFELNKKKEPVLRRVSCVTHINDLFFNVISCLRHGKRVLLSALSTTYN
jgi:hypothetical protein